MERSKLDYEIVKKIKCIVTDAKKYLDNNELEKLQLSIIAEFPEISFDEGSESNPSRLS